jgi:preprotein translocase subunit SecA
MGQIYDLLGLSIGCIAHDSAYIYDSKFQQEEQNGKRDEARDTLGGFKVEDSYLRPCARKEAYAADITYGTNNEFGFDYLRDNMVYDLQQKSQRDFHFAIVDEVDSILIDEARTPLIISAPDEKSSEMYAEFSRITPKLVKDADYEIDEKMKAVTLTEKGINNVEKILGMGNIYEEKGIKYVHHLEQALRAEALFKKDRDYVIKNGQVIIVDEFTGRMLEGRRYSGGLHQALEAKESVDVQPESLTLASVTFQNYFRMYEKLGGMTGTAETSAEEFDKVYKLEVVIIPTNKPLLRKSFPDMIYKNEAGKFTALVREIKERHEQGQPVLVGTTSIVKNEYLGKLLDREGVPHQILNAKHHEQEGEIIAQAGRKDAVTIATNMAGRGVDIVLGGNPVNEDDAAQVKKSGGLHIIGTERHEARRIDNQLRGRSGRQGDPGSSQFFVSLEDDLLRIFGGDRIKSMMEKLNIPEDQPIEAKIISGVIETAQGKIEGMNFDMRKHLLDYDDVLNKHREIIYKKRREILEKSKNGNELKKWMMEIAEKNGFSSDDYNKKEQEVGQENMRQIEKIVALRTLDFLWMDHLENMESLRDSVRLRAYGQQDPLVEYKREGHKMFQRMLELFESNTINTIFKAQLQQKPSTPAPTQKFSDSTSSTGQQFENTSRTVGSRNVGGEKVGRNDPCPCGKKDPATGKPIKYKKCCGK